MKPETDCLPPVHFGLQSVIAIYLSHRYSGRRLREIGQEFGIGESAVSQESRTLRRRVEQIRGTACL